MWIPKAFAAPDRVGHGLMRRYSFGVLITLTDSGLMATHLPLMLDAATGPLGVLIGHVARANPHSRGLEGREALVVFQGPHSYISPAWYRDQATVPTWNYAAVHVYGTIRLMPQERLAAYLKELVKVNEAANGTDWRLDDTVLQEEIGGVVGFEIEISRQDTKLKLNQNRSREDLEGVIRALHGSPDPSQRGVAELMAEHLKTTTT
jgi:transcriptional regulator